MFKWLFPKTTYQVELEKWLDSLENRELAKWLR